jgi:hypothetical protein
LLSRDKNDINAWHLAAMRSRVDLFVALLQWCKELRVEEEELRKSYCFPHKNLGKRHKTEQHMVALLKD